MAEEDDAEQHCHVTHAEDVHDDAADERECIEPGEADARGKETIVTGESGSRTKPRISIDLKV